MITIIKGYQKYDSSRNIVCWLVPIIKMYLFHEKLFLNAKEYYIQILKAFSSSAWGHLNVYIFNLYDRTLV